MIKNSLILTGGHAATTAVAVIEEIKSQNKDWKLYWIGVKNAIEGKKIVTLESEVLPRLGIKFLTLTTGRLQRKFTFWTIPSILKIPIGFIQSFYYLLKVKPRAVLSFGGFAALPVVINAKILNIPVIVHEQTSVAGRANLICAKFASVVTLARPESKKYFGNVKCVFTGNPVMKEVSKLSYKKKPNHDGAIFITGGSRGSQSINEVIEKTLKTLLSRHKIIHQTGGLDYLKFSELKQKLPAALRHNYEVFVRVNPLEIGKIYEKSRIIISRAGANTVSEVMAIKKPAIFIPLPISFMNEQTKNAEIARDWGIAKIIKQDKLNPDILIRTIDDTVDNIDKIFDRVKTKKCPDIGAAARLVRIMAKYML